MAASIIRIRAEAWANRIFLNGVPASLPAEKVAAGLLLFMAHRKLIARELGQDYLLALPYLSYEDFSFLLLSFKGMYVQMQRMEKALRSSQGDELYDRLFSGAEPDPLAYRIAASLSVQYLSAHIAPQSRIAAAQSIVGVVRAALPKLPMARTVALRSRSLYEELCELLPMSADEVLNCVEALTPQELAQPLAPPPAWMVGLLSTGR